jgi:predicted amidohydrolase YtcJ
MPCRWKVQVVFVGVDGETPRAMLANESIEAQAALRTSCATLRPTLVVVLLGGCASMPTGQADATRPAPVVARTPQGDTVAISLAGARIDRVERSSSSTTATVVPALTDAHGHVVGLGLSLVRVDLRSCRSPGDCAGRVRGMLSRVPPGAWIQGRGWDQNLYPDQQFPTRAELDAVAPETPVYVRRVDGHAAWANSEALRRAKITRDTPDPPGGKVLKDAKGEPTGILIDRAGDLVDRAIPPPSELEIEQAILRAQDLLVSEGLTSAHEMGISVGVADIYLRLAREGRLKVRIYAHWAAEPSILDEAFRRGPIRVDGPDDLFALRAIKLYADGALGSRGAHLKAPYSDDPHNTGLVVTPASEIEQISHRALAAGFQVSTHAIGDTANHDVLEAYAHAGVTPAARFRIEHAQIVDLVDIPRFASLGVIASMQPTHGTSDMPWAEKRLGRTRLAGAYAWHRFLDAGVPLAFGSDFPVELSDPRLGLFAAITRTDLQGQPPGGWLPDQRLTVEETLRAFTSGAAYAAFEESWRGKLEPGMAADLTVFDGPLDTPEHIVKRKVLMTIVAGRVVYDARTAERPP